MGECSACTGSVVVTHNRRTKGAVKLGKRKKNQGRTGMKSGGGGGSETEERAPSQLREGVEDLADEAAGFPSDISLFILLFIESYSSFLLPLASS